MNSQHNTPYTVYILRTSGNTLYIGQTNNLPRRLALHKQGKGSKYIRAFSSFILVYTEMVPTVSVALKREYMLKQLSKDAKELLVVKASAKNLRRIPGVGPSIAKDLQDLGMYTVESLRDASAETLYAQLWQLRRSHIDRCVLYVFRCAVYFSSHTNHDREKLQWWYWKDKEKE